VHKASFLGESASSIGFIKGLELLRSQQVKLVVILAISQIELYFLPFGKTPDDGEYLVKKNGRAVIVLFVVIIQASFIFDPPILAFFNLPEVSAGKRYKQNDKIDNRL
jgi:hypothetical protein